MNRSLAGFLAVLIASHLATALCAPAGVGLHDLPAPASFPELFAEPPTVGTLFAPEATGAATDLEAVFPQDAGSEAAPAATASAGNTIRLGAPPAGLFLMLQGIFCVAFFRGRRKWAAILVAALAAGRSGICSLPRLLVAPKLAKALPSEPVRPANSHVAQDATTQRPGIDYTGLLRRLGQGAETAGIPGFVRALQPIPSGVVVPAFSAPLHAAAVSTPSPSEALGFVFVTQTSEAVCLPDGFHSPLFARPPPLAA